LGYLSGVGSSIQTQLNNKQATITSGITTGLTTNYSTNKVVITDGSGKLGTHTCVSGQLAYLQNVTSDIQTQTNKCNFAIPYYAGYIGSTGTVMRNNGYYTFTITKTNAGEYPITFGTALSSNQYTVSLAVRNTAPFWISYHNQTTTGFYYSYVGRSSKFSRYSILLYSNIKLSKKYRFCLFVIIGLSSVLSTTFTILS